MLFLLYALSRSTLQYTHYTVYGSYYKSLILALKVNAAILTIFGTLLGDFPTLCYIFFLVMGPRKSSYLKIAPKGSFIHTDNFPQGAKALAKYLVELDEVK